MAVFREMMHLLEPAHHVPSQATIIENDDAKSEMLAQLASASSKITLTTDCWTALKAKSYMRAHFANE